MFPISKEPLTLIAVLMIFAFAGRADDHVVPLSDLHRDMNSAASERAKNLAEIDRLLSTPVVQDQLSKANLKGDRVQAVISHLDDKELARLADRARAADQDVRAGGTGEILFIVGLALVIFLIVELTQIL